MTTKLIRGMDMAEYHRSQALSNSGLTYLAQCPAMFFAQRLNPSRPAEVEKGGHLHGNLAHCAFLEPQEFGARYVAVPEDAPKKPTSAQWNAKKPSPESIAAMEWWTAYGEKHKGKRFISLEEHEIAHEQALNLFSLQDVWGGRSMRELWPNGEAEVSAFWNDPITGIECRCRPDMVVQINEHQCILLDVKTYSSAEPSEVRRQIARKGYWRQAAHYSIGYHLASGLEVVDFIFLFVEAQWPFLAGSYNLSEEFMREGMAEQRALIDLYAECIKKNEWPSYTKGTITLDMPSYMIGSQETEVSFAD